MDLTSQAHRSQIRKSLVVLGEKVTPERQEHFHEPCRQRESVFGQASLSLRLVACLASFRVDPIVLPCSPGGYARPGGQACH